MDNIKVKEQFNWGPPVLTYDLSTDLFDKIKSIKPEYKQGKDTTNIDGSLKINCRYGYSNDNWLLVQNLLDGYFKNYISKSTSIPVKYELSGLWVNGNSTIESINPHIHEYCDISFVLYIQSNQDIIDQDEIKEAGYTCFKYGQPSDNRAILNNIHSNLHRPVDGELVIFPSNLLHFVIPFNIPNVQRYTMSGNLQLITN